MSKIYGYDFPVPEDIQFEFGETVFNMEIGTGYFHYFKPEHQVTLVCTGKVVCCKSGKDWLKQNQNLCDNYHIQQKLQLTVEYDLRHKDNKFYKYDKQTYENFANVDNGLRNLFVKSNLVNKDVANTLKLQSQELREKKETRGIVFQSTNKETGKPVQDVHLSTFDLDYKKLKKEDIKNTPFYADHILRREEEIKTKGSSDLKPIPETCHLITTKVELSKALAKQLGRSPDISYPEFAQYLANGARIKFRVEVGAWTYHTLSQKAKVRIPQVQILQLGKSNYVDWEEDDLDKLAEDEKDEDGEDDFATKKFKSENYDSNCNN